MDCSVHLAKISNLEKKIAGLDKKIADYEHHISSSNSGTTPSCPNRPLLKAQIVGLEIENKAFRKAASDVKKEPAINTKELHERRETAANAEKEADT